MTLNRLTSTSLRLIGNLPVVLRTVNRRLVGRLRLRSTRDNPTMNNPHSTPHFGLVLDCGDPERLAEFWAQALGYTNVGAAGVYVALYPARGEGPKLLLQRVT